MSSPENKAMVCEHGQLARVCDYCERDAEIAALESKLAAAEREREELRVQINAVRELVAAAPDETTEQAIRSYVGEAESAASERAIETVRDGVQEVWADEFGPDDGLTGEKPVLRFRWFQDHGDRSVGMPPHSYWCVAANMDGTELADLIASRDAAQAAMRTLLDYYRKRRDEAARRHAEFTDNKSIMQAEFEAGLHAGFEAITADLSAFCSAPAADAKHEAGGE